jgi:phosphatidylserine/phosphatidylglycerophosphate/cardiolipin synthase-like enzyme
VAVKLIIQPDAGLAPVVQAIRLARRTIDIAIFRLSRPEIESALAGAVQRGVKVRALVAHTNRGGDDRLRKLEQRLLAGGVTVSRSADDLLKYHGKYLIIDDTLHLFGFNYTKADTIRSRSFGVQTRDRRAVRDAQQLFECDLSRQPYSGSAKSPLVVSPETARETLSHFIGGARHRLVIYDARLEDRAFVDLLKARVAAGVTVQVIGKAPRLEAGTEVRALKDLRLHVRAIMRDGTQVFVGSQSMRRLELDRRREVGLIVNNPSVCRAILAVFERDWEAAAPKDEKNEKNDKSDKYESETPKTDADAERLRDKQRKEAAVERAGRMKIPANGIVEIKSAAETPHKSAKRRTAATSRSATHGSGKVAS